MDGAAEMRRPEEVSTSGAGAASIQRLSIAPMMQCTDKHFRYLARLVTRHTHLWTEMVVDQSVLNGGERVLGEAQPYEHPVTVQLGGCCPELLARAARRCAHLGYDEINLNVGCPSPRVVNQKSEGQGFGAKLMLEPQRVAACVRAMRDVVSIPVTVKCRIGVDDVDSYEELCSFVRTVAAAAGYGAHFVVHARKALLSGLSPAQNRCIPPLHYDVVHRLKRDFPDLLISINGGISTFEQTEEQLQLVDGVMIGRQAYKNLWMLADADRRLFGAQSNPARCRREVIEKYSVYAQTQIDEALAKGTPPKHLVNLARDIFKAMAGMLFAVRGERRFCRFAEEQMVAWRKMYGNMLKPGQGALPLREAILEGLTLVGGQRELDEPPWPPTSVDLQHPPTAIDEE